MFKALQAWILSKKYTKDSVEGAGAVKGKNCTIDSVVDITGGKRTIFKWWLDNGTAQTTNLDVMNGAKGDKGETGATGAQGIQGPQGPQGAAARPEPPDAAGRGLQRPGRSGKRHFSPRPEGLESRYA